MNSNNNNNKEDMLSVEMYGAVWNCNATTLTLVVDFE
jgi:hypothetical protein